MIPLITLSVPFQLASDGWSHTTNFDCGWGYCRDVTNLYLISAGLNFKNETLFSESG